MQPRATRLGVDHQQLQQFLTSSTWDVVGVRRRLATAAVEVVAPTVWVVDDTGFAKDGPASACVARQYSGTLGKVGNSQIAAASTRPPTPPRQCWTGGCSSRNLGTKAVYSTKPATSPTATPASCGGSRPPWTRPKKKPHVRKEVPREERIAQIQRRRTASKIPDNERYRPKWLMALEMIDELAGWGLRPPLLTADAGYGQVAEFRQGLRDRGIAFKTVPSRLTVAHLNQFLADGGRPAGPPPIPATRIDHGSAAPPGRTSLLHLHDRRPPAVRDVSARDLGVKAAIGSEADHGNALPAYLPRLTAMPTNSPMNSTAHAATGNVPGELAAAPVEAVEAVEAVEQAVEHVHYG
jgi:hypothetical protein